MKLNYKMKANGMYIISSRDFDDIATNVLKEYMPNVLEYPQPVNIDHLATECLFLDVKYGHIIAAARPAPASSPKPRKTTSSPEPRSCPSQRIPAAMVS